MDRYEKAALKLVNQIRKLQGKEELQQLLLGDTNIESSCPIANSIKGEANDTEIRFSLSSLGEIEIQTPDVVGEFINRFDEEDGENPYTHLMSKSSLADYNKRLKEEKEWEEQNKND